MAFNPAPASDDIGSLMAAVDYDMCQMNDADWIALRKRIFGAKQGAAFNAETLLAIVRSHLLIQHALRLDVRNR